MIEGAVYVDGKVAVRYYEPVPKYVKVGSKGYVCSVKHGVSVLLVDEADAPAFLALEGGCCGGKRKLFSLCSEHAYKVFDTGDR